MSDSNRGTMVPMTQGRAVALVEKCWPDAPEHDKLVAAVLCRQYNLNPLNKQIYLIPFKNKKGGTDWSVVLGINASRAIAKQSGYKYSYADGPRLMTNDEQAAILGEVDNRFLWAITILKDTEGNQYPGYGNWPKDQNVYGEDKGNSKRNMAFIRSERNALDKLAPGILPPDYIETGDEAYSPEISYRELVQIGQEEQDARVQEDIEDLWPPETRPDDGRDDRPEIDMVWLKESLEEIRDNDSALYHRLTVAVKNMLGDKHPANWTEAMSLLTREQAEEFVRAVSEARG